MSGCYRESYSPNIKPIRKLTKKEKKALSKETKFGLQFNDLPGLDGRKENLMHNLGSSDICHSGSKLDGKVLDHDVLRTRAIVNPYLPTNPRKSDPVLQSDDAKQRRMLAELWKNEEDGTVITYELTATVIDNNFQPVNGYASIKFTDKPFRPDMKSLRENGLQIAGVDMGHGPGISLVGARSANAFAIALQESVTNRSGAWRSKEKEVGNLARDVAQYGLFVELDTRVHITRT